MDGLVLALEQRHSPEAHDIYQKAYRYLLRGPLGYSKLLSESSDERIQILFLME